mmetsp:Transcript_99220/g.289544  ORF Transcript_99220/g.289544 Transcript_99220/m.289544 type:complete len:350 (-) Transcript_99220:26-1075(-)
MEHRTRLILDVDTGTDDALALLLALRVPTVEVLAVTCVHGNVDVDQVLDNTLRTLDAAGARPDLPVARGFEAPLVEPVKHCPEIHGQDGLADLRPALPASRRKPCRQHAVELLNETLRAAGGPVTVVALAPLTNIAVAARMCPALWREKVERIAWMGGAVASGGNAAPWAEANARYDPEAAHMVLGSGLPLLIYPWDVFLKVGFTKQELLALDVADAEGARAGEGERPAWSLLAGRLLWRELQHFGVEETMIGDAGALAAVLRPGAVKTKRLHVAVELQGSLTRGMTACDLRGFAHPPDEPKRPANAEVVVDLDARAIKAFFAEHVLSPPEQEDGRRSGTPAAKRRREG